MKKLLTSAIWDNYVPIIETKGEDGEGNTYDIYLQDEIASPVLYNQTCHLLNKVTKKDTVYIHLNTPGGYLDSAFRIQEGLDKCKAKTVAVLTGTVASAGTIIALRCDEIEVPKHLQFLIHNYSGGSSGKGNEIIEHVTFSNNEISDAFNNVYLGFLTPKEIKKVIAGKDMWMGSKEVAERFKELKKIRNSKSPKPTKSTPSKDKEVVIRKDK